MNENGDLEIISREIISDRQIRVLSTDGKYSRIWSDVAKVKSRSRSTGDVKEHLELVPVKEAKEPKSEAEAGNSKTDEVKQSKRKPRKNGKSERERIADIASQNFLRAGLERNGYAGAIYDQLDRSLFSNFEMRTVCVERRESERTSPARTPANCESSTKPTTTHKQFAKRLYMRKANGANNFYRIIHGDMQSQKTPIMLTLAVRASTEYRLPVIIIVPNKNADLYQMKTRAEQFVSSYNKEMKHQTTLTVLEPERGKYATPEQFRSAVNGETSQIFIAMCSNTDIKPINDIVATLKLKRFVMILDEADFLDSGVESKRGSQLDILQSHCSVMYNVTATPLSVALRRHVTRANYIKLPRPEGYKGLWGVHFRDLPEEAEYCSGVTDDPLKKDKNITKFLEDFCSKKTEIYENSMSKEKHPRYVLVRTGNTIEPQLKLARYVHQKYPSTVVITYNGGKITVRSSLLPARIVLQNGTISIREQGIHNFPEAYIGDIITWLHENRYDGIEDNEGTESFRNIKFEKIIVFAGVMADRGITFGASNFQKCRDEGKQWWHLTDMYGIFSRKATAYNISSILQVSGRICGVYRDHIPLIFWSNNCDGIRKAYALQEEIFSRVLENASYHDVIGREIKEVAVNKNKVPTGMKCKIGAKSYSLKNVLHTVSDDREFGGWTSEYQAQMRGDSTHEEADFGDTSRRREDPISKEEFDRLKNMFARWAKPNVNTCIALFMDQLRPTHLYTEDELKSEAEEHGIRMSDLTRKQRATGSSHGCGNIMVKVGNRYRLRACLVDLFIRTFNYVPDQPRPPRVPRESRAKRP
jgi:hypothetical protein